LEAVGVLTNPDSPRGRHGDAVPTDVGAAAERFNHALVEAGLPPMAVLTCERLDAPVRERVGALKPDILVSFAYGKIFGPRFLALFPLGGVNVHPSLLPKYRGATPIPAALLNRDTETGITVQRLALEMDSGDILAQESLSIHPRATNESLSLVVAEQAATLLHGVLTCLAAGSIAAVPQDASRATYCGIIRKEDGWIDWGLSALELDARIRAFTPWPLCATEFKGLPLHILEAHPYQGACVGGTRVGSDPAAESASGPAIPAGTVLDIDKQAGILVQTGRGPLAVARLQWGTKKAMDWRSFLNGARDFIGSRLG
jgi:methionyl-tRNA formyltransferase